MTDNRGSRPRAGPRPAAADQPAPGRRRAGRRARIGVLAACGGSGGGADEHRDRGRRRHRGDPGGDRRPVPGRRLQRAERAGRERRRPERHHEELRRRLGVAEGVPTTLELTLRRRRRRRPARGRRGLPLALRRGGQYSLYDQAIAERELPARGAGERRDGTLTFRASSRPPTWPLAPHPLRDLPEPRRRPTGGYLATSQLAFPRTSATSSTRPPATSRACQPRPDLARPDMVFGDGDVTSSRRSSGSAGGGSRSSSTWGSDPQARRCASKKRRIRPHASSAEGS